jgi:hypothetical protein
VTAAAAVLVPLAGCAVGSLPHSSAAPSAHDEAFENYLAYAGPPIDHFTWLGRFYSWQPLGKDRLVVFTTPGDAYLLKVWPPCDLRFVINAIGITSTSRTVYARADSVTVNTPEAGPGPMRCPIDEIRRVDYKRLQADLRAQAQRNKAARQGAAEQPQQQPQQPK